MQRLEVSGAVRLIYKSLGVKGLIFREKYGVTMDCRILCLLNDALLTESYDAFEVSARDI